MFAISNSGILHSYFGKKKIFHHSLDQLLLQCYTTITASLVMVSIKASTNNSYSAKLKYKCTNLDDPRLKMISLQTEPVDQINFTRHIAIYYIINVLMI